MGFPSARFGFAVLERESRPSKTPAPLNIARRPPPLNETATFGMLSIVGFGIPVMFMLFNHVVNLDNVVRFREEIYAVSAELTPELYH